MAFYFPLQNTAISDRPKAKPVSKKEGKNLRKQQFQPSLFGQQQQQVFTPQVASQQTQLGTQLQPQQQSSQQQQQPSEKQLQQTQQQQQITLPDTLNVQGLDLDSLDQDTFVIKDDSQENLLTASILQQFHSPQIRAAFVGSSVSVSKIL